LSEQEFLDKNAGAVYALALRLTGNRADAEDLAQDALLRAVRALPGFRGDSRASTWAYRITVNTWKNRVRAERRRKFWRTVTLGLVSGNDGEEKTTDIRADEPPLDSELEKSEEAAAVQNALLQLDDEDRAIVVLREINEQSYEDIGAALNLPQGTVKSRLFRARAKLKSILTKPAAA
jgi:RNA polymerase sigma-70 factor (ECF subfamily)